MARKHKPEERLADNCLAPSNGAAKTNPIRFSRNGAQLLNPGFVPHSLDHAGVLSLELLSGIEAQMEAFHDGAGWSTDLMFDLNFAPSPSAVTRLEQRIGGHSLRWLEYDQRSPTALADLRARMKYATCVARSRLRMLWLQGSSRCSAGRRRHCRYLMERLRRSSPYQLCDAYAVNVAPHNFYGPIADLIAANFCAVTPNLEIMEFEGDDVPWKYALLTEAPTIANGQMQVPSGVGWGADVDEAALCEHLWPGSRRPV